MPREREPPAVGRPGGLRLAVGQLRQTAATRCRPCEWSRSGRPARRSATCRSATRPVPTPRGRLSPAGKARRTRRPRPFGSTVSMLEETNSGSQPCGIGGHGIGRRHFSTAKAIRPFAPGNAAWAASTPDASVTPATASASQARCTVTLRMTTTVPLGRLLDISGTPQSGAGKRSCAGCGTLVR